MGSAGRNKLIEVSDPASASTGGAHAPTFVKLIEGNQRFLVRRCFIRGQSWISRSRGMLDQIRLV